MLYNFQLVLLLIINNKVLLTPEILKFLKSNQIEMINFIRLKIGEGLNFGFPLYCHNTRGCNGANVDVLELSSSSDVSAWFIYIIEKYFGQSFLNLKAIKVWETLLVILAMQSLSFPKLPDHSSFVLYYSFVQEWLRT